MKLPKISLLAVLATILLVCFSFSLAQAAVQFNFETGTEGWVISNDTNNVAAITSVAQSTTPVYNGTKSLKLNCDLNAAVAKKQKGEAMVMAPGDLNAQTVTVYVYCPTGSQGTQPSYLNGFRVVMKDAKWNSAYSNWRTITGTGGIPLNTWTAVTFSTSTWSGFNANDVITVGVAVGTGGGATTSTYAGPIYIDYVNYTYNTVSVPLADYKYTFDSMTAQLQKDKPYDSHRPYFDTDPFWGGLAFSSSNVTIETVDSSPALAISTASFQGAGASDAARKGCIQGQFFPNLDISNKNNKKIQFRVKFQNYVGPFDMTASIVVYDRRAYPMTYWFISQERPIGGNKTWNLVTFDLNDTTQHKPPLGSAPTAVQYKQFLRVGLQLYANTAYTGKVWIDNITIGGQEVKANWTMPANYVTTSGKQLMDGNKPLLFAGTNNYYMFYKTHFMIDALLDDLQTKGINVVRAWAFCDGKGEYCVDSTPTVADGNEGIAFQPTLGTYDELSFTNLDYVIAAAGKRGMRLILPFVNYWSDKDQELEANRTNSFGGMAKYLEWRNIPLTYTNGSINNKNVFYTSSTIKADFKAYINYVVNRVNTYNNVKYKNDKTIMAWELANEPENEQDVSGNEFYNWASEISNYIVSVDTNHLVGIGDIGWLKLTYGWSPPADTDWAWNGFKGTDWERDLGLSNVKFATVHLYPDWWSRSLPWVSEWITYHTRAAQDANKPIIYEEFGRRARVNYDREDAYTNWTDTILKTRSNGDNVWMMVSKQDDNTYYPDYDQFNFNIYSTSTMNIIQNHQANINNYGLSYDSSTYSFEDGTVQNWSYFTGGGETGITAVANSAATVFAGSRSLLCTATNLSNSNNGFAYVVPSGSVGPGQILLTRIYLPAGGPTTLQARIFLQDNGWNWLESGSIALSTGTWKSLYCVLSTGTTPLQRIGIKFTNTSATAYNGSIYVDSFQVIPGVADSATYNFEDGTTQGWTGTNGTAANTYYSGYAYAGHHWLQTTAANYGASVVPSASAVGGWCITTRIFIPGGTPAGLKAQVYIKNNSWTWMNGDTVQTPAGSWSTIKYVVPKGTSTPLQEMGVKVMNSDGSNYTGGSVYLDSIWVQDTNDNTRMSFEDATSMGFNGSVVPDGNKMAATAFVYAGRYAVLCRSNSAWTYAQNPTVYPSASTTLNAKVYTHYNSWGTTTYVQLYVKDANWTFTGSATPVQLTEKQWNNVSVTVPANAVMPIQEIGVKFMDGNYAESSGANMYLDSVDW
jgi:hypothetical protein